MLVPKHSLCRLVDVAPLVAAATPCVLLALARTTVDGIQSLGSNTANVEAEVEVSSTAADVIAVEVSNSTTRVVIPTTEPPPEATTTPPPCRIYLLIFFQVIINMQRLKLYVMLVN
jgi:hypothetical protein